MSAWSAWSTCTASCNGGTQSQTRTVLTTALNGGLACEATTQSRACNTQACVPSPVDCTVGDWSAWSTCSQSCNGGIQTRSRQLLTGASNGGVCWPLLEEQKCNTAACVPVDCQYTAWSAWSACSQACGGGLQSSTRAVVKNAEFGGFCSSELARQQACNTQTCEVANCVVSAWSQWSQCSVTCGVGFQTRSRQILSAGSGIGSLQCPTDLSEKQTCNMQACTSTPVDCVTSTWSSAWSNCSAGCGGGFQVKIVFFMFS